MARATPARLAAAQVLGDVRRRDARARDVLRGSSRMRDLDERDRAFASRLVLGVVGALGMLDAVIDQHLSRPRLEPKVRDALRLASFELLFLSTPAQVAVSQGVELVRGVRPRAAGMANAVLRRVAERDVPRRTLALERVRAREGSVEDLSLVSGYPAWLLERVWRERGQEAARDLACSAPEPAPVFVAANLARCSAQEAHDLLARKGLSPRAAQVEGSFVLDAPATLATSGLVDDAAVVVADLSAQQVADLAAPEPGMRVLEVGQGRGTKTILLQSRALRAGGPAMVVGIDSEAFKVDVSRQRMSRAGLAQGVRSLVFDACELDSSELPPVLRDPFDLVFVDAPCSGTGTLRRHPEIAWRLVERDVTQLAQLQARMLAAASTRVRAGGRLCYATCSILREENQDVVSLFLDSAAGRAFDMDGEPFVSHPSPQGPDGHFCACFVRRSE
ncbi:MAG: transcription antitermination factor NusB [Coriobacteriales bacterium]|nr:transcription antitermination factor NusB [Coriobacteriales bacterium]